MASLTQSSSGGGPGGTLALSKIVLDPIFTDIDDFSDFYNFDDTVLDKLQLDSGTGTHPSTSTVPQATPQLEDGTPPVPAQPDSTQKRKRGRPKAGSKDKQARKKRQKHSEANVT